MTEDKKPDLLPKPVDHEGDWMNKLYAKAHQDKLSKQQFGEQGDKKDKGK